MTDLVKCPTCGIRTSVDRRSCPRCKASLTGAGVVARVSDRRFGLHRSTDTTEEPGPAGEAGTPRSDKPSIFDTDISSLFPARRRFGGLDFLLIAGLVGWMALFSDLNLWLDNGVASFGLNNAEIDALRAVLATQELAPPVEADPTEAAPVSPEPEAADSPAAEGPAAEEPAEAEPAADAAPPEASVPRAPLPPLHVSLDAAIARFDTGDFAGAVPHFEAAVAVAPEEPRGVNGLGRTLVRLDRRTDALPLLEQAVRLEPGSLAYRTDLAGALGDLGLWSRAVREYREAATRFPDDAEIRYRLGRALYEWGDHRGSIESHLTAIAQTPDDPRFYLALGQSYEALDRPTDAVEAYTRYLGMEPGPALRTQISDRIDALQAPDRPVPAIASR